jgi:hypothetical protein
MLASKRKADAKAGIVIYIRSNEERSIQITCMCLKTTAWPVSFAIFSPRKGSTQLRIYVK